MNTYPVLIVEDDIVDRLSLERWCKKNLLNYQVANNGLDALNLTKENRYSMILSDIDMPVMNGITLINEIRKNEMLTNSHIPVVAVSANEQLELNNKFEQFGFDFYLSKPAPFEELNKLKSKFLIH